MVFKGDEEINFKRSEVVKKITSVETIEKELFELRSEIKDLRKTVEYLRELVVESRR